MRVVLKIGGSILFRNERLNEDLVEEYYKVIKQLTLMTEKVAVIVGGGRPARDFVKVGAKLGLPKSKMDLLGIESARQNARLFASAFEEAYPSPPVSFEELLHAISSHNLVFMGGLQPGQSTNAVAAIVAESLKADILINLSDIDYIYDKDPQQHTDAIKLTQLSYDELIQLVSGGEQNPGKYALFDVVGALVVARSKIELRFVNGKHPENIIKVVKGEEVGSVVR